MKKVHTPVSPATLGRDQYTGDVVELTFLQHNLRA